MGLNAGMNFSVKIVKSFTSGVLHFLAPNDTKCTKSCETNPSETKPSGTKPNETDSYLTKSYGTESYVTKMTIENFFRCLILIQSSYGLDLFSPT